MTPPFLSHVLTEAEQRQIEAGGGILPHRAMPTATVTPSVARRVVELRAAGVKQQAIKAETGVSLYVIWQLQGGWHWLQRAGLVPRLAAGGGDG